MNLLASSSVEPQRRQRRPRVWLAVALLAMPLAGPVRGDVGSRDAQELIDRMIAELGGREAIGELRSLAVEADCTGPGGAFQTRVESFAPDSVYFAQRADDYSTEIWSTGARTWTRDAETGPRELDAGVRSFVRAHEIHLLVLELEMRFSGHRLSDASAGSGGTCRWIDMEDAEGYAASICIRESDGLPTLLEMNPPGAQGPIVVRFEDWREIEGIRYFHSFVLTEGPERTFTYDYRTVEPNGVAADRFVTTAAPSLQQEQDSLLEILRRDRQAHLATDPSMLSASLADHLVEIDTGEIRLRSRTEVEAFFEAYFEGATYEMWEDLQPPVIRLSTDATMAWVARRVGVRRRSPGPKGEVGGAQPVVEFTSAYTATYEKQGHTWKMTSVTSTFLPDDR